MFIKRLIAAVKRFWRLINVTRLSAKQKELFQKASDALDSGDRKGCAAAIYESMGVEPPSEEPIRTSAGEVTVLKSEMSDQSHDPDYNEKLLHIKSTGHYVSLLIFNEGTRGWNPDFNYARLTDKDGKEIKGKAGKLPPEDRAILEKLFCKKAPASAPAHKIG